MERCTDSSRDSRNSNAIRLRFPQDVANKRLWDYEDTNLTPEQITAMQAENVELRELLRLAVEDIKLIAKRSQRSSCDICNKEKCIGCYVERELEWQHADRMSKVMGGVAHDNPV